MCTPISKASTGRSSSPPSRLIRHARFPLWDPCVCGIPFAGNIQAALFYPHLDPFRGQCLRLQAMSCSRRWKCGCFCMDGWRFVCAMSGCVVEISHAWRACWVPWCSRLGDTSGFAERPWASSTDTVGHRWRGSESIRRSGPRLGGRCGRLLAASALCSSPDIAQLRSVRDCSFVYAAARSWRCGLATLVAVAASLVVAAVQLLPAAEASALKTFDPKYGPGIHDPLFYIHFLVPDWVGIRWAIRIYTCICISGRPHSLALCGW